MRREKGDYSRAEEYLETIGDQIEYEYGKPFNQLSRDEKNQAILDHYFKGIGQYWNSANALRIGMKVGSIYAYTGIDVKVSNIRGHRVIRDSKTGRFRQWVKE